MLLVGGGHVHVMFCAEGDPAKAEKVREAAQRKRKGVQRSVDFACIICTCHLDYDLPQNKSEPKPHSWKPAFSSIGGSDNLSRLYPIVYWIRALDAECSRGTDRTYVRVVTVKASIKLVLRASVSRLLLEKIFCLL